MDDYQQIWHSEDFDEMDWHDNVVHGMAFNYERRELSFDIDYILKWVAPKGRGRYFKYWVAPATLVFRNVRDLVCDIPQLDISIEEVVKENPGEPYDAAGTGDPYEYDWTLLTAYNGEFSFKSTGFTQYLRSKPTFGSNKIDLDKRGGISFEQKTFDKL